MNMKKNILNRLAAIADQLDDLKYHKEASLVTTIFLRVAQESGLGWYYPAGAANDPRAPYNQDNSGYESASEEVDGEIDTEYLPAVNSYYSELLRMVHAALQAKGGRWEDPAAREQAVEDIFNIDPYYSTGEVAFKELHKKLVMAFGDRSGSNIADSVAEAFSEHAPRHHSLQSLQGAFSQIANAAIQPHLDGLYEARYESMSDYEPDYDRYRDE